MRDVTCFGTRNLICYLAIVLITAGCKSSTDSGFELPPPERFSLSTTVSPSQAGSVNPSSGTFEDGTSVSVEAVTNEGWMFDRWSGDLESQENPFTFNISQNTSLTANFVDTQSMYEVLIVLTASNASIELKFGQIEDATDGFDDGVDIEAPPEPPEGTLNAWFEIDDQRLFHDFRSATNLQVIWELNYQTGNSDLLELNWEFDITQADGTLILTDQQQSFEVNMFDEGSYELSQNQNESGTLIISYSLD